MTLVGFKFTPPSASPRGGSTSTVKHKMTENIPRTGVTYNNTFNLINQK